MKAWTSSFNSNLSKSHEIKDKLVIYPSRKFKSWIIQCTILQMSNDETGMVQKKREVRLDIEPSFLWNVLRSLPATYVCHSLFSQGENADIITLMFLSKNHLASSFLIIHRQQRRNVWGRIWEPFNSDRTIPFNWKTNHMLYSCAWDQ